MELDPSAAPQRAEGDDHFVEALAAGGEVLPGKVELLLAPTDADAEAQPVARQHRGRPDALGHRHEVAQRGDVDAGGEEQVLGGARTGRDHGHGIGPGRVVLPARRPVLGLGVGVARRALARVEEVVGDVHAAVAQAIAGLGHREDLARGQEGDSLMEPDFVIGHDADLSGPGRAAAFPRRGPMVRKRWGCAWSR